MIIEVLSWIFVILGGLLLLHTMIRVVRRFYKFPIPYFFTPLIDHPLRRRFWQPPDEMPIRHEIKEGMRVLEVGPGRGTYTLAAARRVGEMGEIVAIDIEPRIIEKLQRMVSSQHVKNVSGEVASVYDLPYEPESFDAIFLMSVIGEIPSPELAFREFFRVLNRDGILAFSEILPDPDYPTRSWLIRQAEVAGFETYSQRGTFFSYTLTFVKKS